MKVDNFDLILDLLGFNNPDEFYFLQIIQRKKDGNVTDIGNNGYRTVKTYYIYSKEQLERKRAKITELCQSNNARAYIYLNKRNAKEVALTAIQQYAQLISEGNAYQGYRVYDSACGHSRAKGYKPLWIVDIDSKEPEYIEKIVQIINSCRGVSDYKIKYRIPTLHGIHLLTIGFDVNQFSQKLALEQLDPIDIHKDNPTLLYYEEPTTIDVGTLSEECAKTVLDFWDVMLDMTTPVCGEEYLSNTLTPLVEKINDYYGTRA